MHFVGFQDDVSAWIEAMDLILQTSTEPEPFGRVIVEGMAAGGPVIAAAAGAPAFAQQAHLDASGVFSGSGICREGWMR
ncbi:hypothetical protein LMG27174_01993 [Paraburkholderia rhynchosiae]|uniref:Uncharacterized protein n=1 Tax=Paraburkholderia rhynchosiae TaxID=487049 RepID=A0A6J5AHD5_9BURK|nr:hypothetical protein LMG27174_01993 [Paraburkholderia rhynchosiae]